MEHAGRSEKSERKRVRKEKNSRHQPKIAVAAYQVNVVPASFFFRPHRRRSRGG